MSPLTSSPSERRWVWTADDLGAHESLTARWESNGWTIEGVVDHLAVMYVLRLTDDFSVRQFLLFRDMEEPDLWLAHDGTGNWAEVNGSNRVDLVGCRHVGVAGCRSTALLPLLAHAFDTSTTGPVMTLMALVDSETLGVDSTAYCARPSDMLGRWAVDLDGVAGEVDVTR